MSTDTSPPIGETLISPLPVTGATRPFTRLATRVLRLVARLLSLTLVTRTQRRQWSQSPLTSRRLVVLAPHMDDEAIGCAGLIHEVIRQGGRVSCVYLTDGAYGLHGEDRLALTRRRIRETEAVAALLGVQDLRFLDQPDGHLAFTPAQFTIHVDRAGVMGAAAATIAQGGMESDEIAALLSGPVHWWAPITYAFLHGSFAHIALNSVWLLAFGAAVCRRFGAARFMLFLAVTAIAGALAHYLVYPYGLQPVIGASAAISGAMGAAVRFAFAPGAPLGAGFSRARDLAAYRQPAPPLLAVLTERRAMTFLALWFVGNPLFGVYAPVGGDATIAWQAHIGGFVAGFLLFSWFDPAARRQTA